MNTLKNKLYDCIHCEGQYYHQIYDIFKQIVFPSYPDSEAKELLRIMASFQGQLSESIHYELSPFPYYGFVYTSAGSCNLLYDNVAYTLKPNSIAFLDFCKPCSIHKNTTDIWDHSFLIISGSLCPFYYNFFYEQKQAVTLLSPHAGTPNRLRTLHTLAQSPFLGDSDLIVPHKLITDILTTLAIEQHNNPYAHRAVPQHISTVLSYIHKHYTEALSLELLARQAHVSKYALSHDFTHYIGTSVMDYVCAQRIEQGKHLLSTSEASVFDISYQLGFSSDAHFVSTFKKRMGITPLQYRKQHNAHFDSLS